jgi:hypothetical protein
VGEVTVGAQREDVHVKRLKLVIVDGNCRQFGRSNKGEITRIEAE